MEGVTAESIRWKETSPGVFERHLDRRELLLKSLCMLAESIGKTNLIVCSYIEYSTPQPDIVDVFGQAWLGFRLRHPHVADELQDTVRVFDANLDPEQTAAESFFVHQEKSMKQVFAELQTGYKAAMHVFPKESKVMVTRGHETCDGRGHLLIWNEFLDIAQAITEGTWVSPSRDDIATRLAPAYDAQTEFKITEQSMAGAGQQLGWMAANEHSLPSHNLDQPPSERNIVRSLQFSEKETISALRAIKARGVTVTPAVQAAVIMASNKIADTPGKPNCGLLSVDVRRYLGEEAKRPLTMSFAGVIREFGTGDFNTTLASCVKGYSTCHADVQNGTISAVTDLMYPAMLQAKGTMPPEQRTYVDMSSPGIMEDFIKYQYGNIEVKDIRLFQRELFAQVWLFWTTFKGRFAGTLVFNDRYHTEQEMDHWLTTFKSEFLNGLGVDQDLEPLGPF